MEFLTNNIGRRTCRTSCPIRPALGPTIAMAAVGSDDPSGKSRTRSRGSASGRPRRGRPGRQRQRPNGDDDQNDDGRSGNNEDQTAEDQTSEGDGDANEDAAEGSAGRTRRWSWNYALFGRHSGEEHERPATAEPDPAARQDRGQADLANRLASTIVPRRRRRRSAVPQNTGDGTRTSRSAFRPSARFRCGRGRPRTSGRGRRGSYDEGGGSAVSTRLVRVTTLHPLRRR